ncbi:exonuclease domain-containing protein [Streptomyces purpurascens]|uniref:exonuclease domain-containing protein n=1 Tax=Streptomyces purpurascens TaxID=1924 RepID=UPI0016771395|nr:exonuclease domain-containing protein [Streptomyces purpurascens]MCE7049512.1 DNA polymerase III subunit epsilon [Streptomyces purpurascens]GHA22221.1 3'-5' exonuclease [Streptomyces purpurascens]
MSAPWHIQRMAALDFESSDKDADTARIVTCALVLVSGGIATDTRTWLLNPGIPMEPGAIAVHKITDEYAAEHGMPAEQGVGEIAKAITEVVAADIPLVGHNIGGYDLNLLDRECRRHLGDSLDGICRQPLTRVIDTMVLDRHCAPFRRRISETQGPYQMRTTAETYGLPWNEEQAHGAEYDALMSARAAYKMGAIAHTPYRERPDWVLSLRTNRFNSLRDITVEELHERQIEWYREDAERYEKWLRDPAKAKEKHDPEAVIPTEWPLRTVPAQREGGDAS